MKLSPFCFVATYKSDHRGDIMKNQPIHRDKPEQQAQKLWQTFTKKNNDVFWLSYGQLLQQAKNNRPKTAHPAKVHKTKPRQTKNISFFQRNIVLLPLIPILLIWLGVMIYKAESTPKPVVSWSHYVADVDFKISQDTLRFDTLAVLRYYILKLTKKEQELKGSILFTEGKKKKQILAQKPTMDKAEIRRQLRKVRPLDKKQLGDIRRMLKSDKQAFLKLAKEYLNRSSSDGAAGQLFADMYYSMWREVISQEPENLTDDNAPVYDLFMHKDTEVLFAKSRNMELCKVRKLNGRYYKMFANGWLEVVSPVNIYQAHTELLVKGKPVELNIGNARYKNREDGTILILPIEPESNQIKKHLYVKKFITGENNRVLNK